MAAPVSSAGRARDLRVEAWVYGGIALAFLLCVILLASSVAARLAFLGLTVWMLTLSVGRFRIMRSAAQPVQTSTLEPLMAGSAA